MIRLIAALFVLSFSTPVEARRHDYRATPSHSVRCHLPMRVVVPNRFSPFPKGDWISLDWLLGRRSA